MRIIVVIRVLTKALKPILFLRANVLTPEMHPPEHGFLHEAARRTPEQAREHGIFPARIANPGISYDDGRSK
jgi:hypothetical protein